MKKNFGFINLRRGLLIFSTVSVLVSLGYYKSINISNNIVMASSDTTVSQDSNTDSFDVNVDLHYKITLDDKVKGTNPNIIKATRQAIFDTDYFFARLQHYNGYSVNNDVLIFDVKEIAQNCAWEVDFRIKKSGTESYNTDFYCRANIIKQKDGSYIGNMFHSSPYMPTGETY
jgi:hypothetical protein